MFKKLLSLLLILALNLNTGLLTVSYAYAQEATESAPAEEPTPSTPEAETPTPESSPTPSSSAPTTTPELTPTPSPTVEETQPETTPTPEITPTPIPETVGLTETLPEKLIQVVDTITSTKQETTDTSIVAEQVSLNTTYKYPQNDKVTVTFTKLPENPGSLSIKQITLSKEEQETLGAFSDTAYDITSDMTDGEFEYTLTLPTPTTNNVEVKTSEDGQNFVTVGGITTQTDTLIITGLNHFTIFVVVGTINGSTATGVAEAQDAVVINEFMFNPSTGNDWIELYNKGTVSRDLNNWVLDDDDPGTSTVMKTLTQTIPAGGFLAIDVSTRLNSTDDTIILKDNLGTTVSVVSYKDGTLINGAQEVGTIGAGESVARSANGGGTWAKASLPTKGYTNENSTVYVDDNFTQGSEFGTQALPFGTIQKGIDSVSASGTVNVAAGTYVETGQILINKNLAIVGNNDSKPTIKPTANRAGISANDAWFLVAPDVIFNLSNVVLDGDIFFVWQAVRSHGTTIINNIDFRNIQGSSSGSPYRGFAILGFGGTVPGGAGSDSHGSGGTPSVLTVTNSTFQQIGRVGVLVKGTGATATISGNTYTGKGDGDFLDYAFEAGAGGSITVSGNNIISDNRGVAGDGSTSAGILVTDYYGTGTSATIEGNTITNNTDGIAIGYDENDASVVVAHYNKLSGNTTSINSTHPTVDATNNWWGSATPDFGSLTSGSIDNDPWCTNSACTAFSGTALITTADPADVSGDFIPEIGSTLPRGSEAYLGRTTTYIGSAIGLGDPDNDIPETIKWKVTVDGPAGSTLTPDMVDLDEVGWTDKTDENNETFHYPFAEQEDGSLVALGSCDENVNAVDHDDGCDTSIGFSLVANDVFTNADKIKFNSNSPLGPYNITYELVDTANDEEIVLSNTFAKTVTLEPEVAISASTDFTINEIPFSPALADSLTHDSDAYYSTNSLSRTLENILGVQWKITLSGPSALIPNMVDLDEVGWKDILNAPSTTVFHYPFQAQDDGSLTALGSCTEPDPVHANNCSTDTFDVDRSDNFTNIDKISFSSSAPTGAYTLTRQLIQLTDEDENIISNLLSRLINVVDATAPTVTKLGDSLADFVLSAGDTNLVFNEILSDSSKTTVQNVLTAGADKTLTYAWDGATLIITATQATTFANDVVVNVSDIAGNTATGLLLVDSALDSNQKAPDSKGAVTVDSATPQVVITNPTQAVNLTISSGTTKPIIDVSSFISGGTGILPAITITSANVNNINVAIPASTVVTSADPTWNGIIAAPTVTTVTLPETSGQTKTLSTAIEVGVVGAKLSFDKAVKLLLPDQAGKKAGYVRTGIEFTEITNTCVSSDDQTAINTDLTGTKEDCKIDSGSDLVIWTKHFTQFATYSQSSTGSSASTTTTSSQGLSAAGAPVCTDTAPQTPPILISAQATGNNTVTLNWLPSTGPLTYYLVAYGTTSGNLQFGNPNVGGEGTTSYTVSGLSGGRTYYFKVRAGNGCTPGAYSNEIAVTIGGTRTSGPAAGFEEGVLGTKTDLQKPEDSDEITQKEEPPTITGTVEGSSSRQGLWASIGSFFSSIFTVFRNLFRR